MFSKLMNLGSPSDKEDPKRLDIRENVISVKSHDPTKILCAPGNQLFSTRDLNKSDREALIQSRLRTCSGVYLRNDPKRENSNAFWPVRSFYALPYSYDPDAPKESRRSTMSIIAKMEDGTYYPTTAAIDPFFRAPQLGTYEDMYDYAYQGSARSTESEEEMPRSNRRSRRSTYELQDKITKPGSWLAHKSTKPWEEGRNVLNLSESRYLMSDHNHGSKMAHVLVPWKNLSDEMVNKIAKQMLLNTKGPYELPTGLSRPETEQVLGKLLAILGFKESAWVDGIRIITYLDDTLKSSYVRGSEGSPAGNEEWSKLKQDFDRNSSNVYQCPVFVDWSVIGRYWTEQPRPMEAKGEKLAFEIPKPAKRPIGNVTVFESEAKVLHQEPTLDNIRQGICELRNLVGQVLAARGDSMKGILLEQHDELVVELTEKISRLQVLNARELEDIKQEKLFVKRKLEDSKRLISGYEEDITDMQEKLNRLDAERLTLAQEVKRATDQSAELVEENQRLAGELQQKELQQQYEEKMAHCNEIQDSIEKTKSLMENVKKEREDAQGKLSDLAEAMEVSLQIKEGATEADIQLTDSVKKNKKKLGKAVAGSPILANFSSAWLDDSEEDSGEYGTPDKTFKKTESVHSLAAMTLTPSKIGLKTWDENLQNFSAWFASMRMQIEAAKNLSGNEPAVIRLILMCMPHKYSWVTNAIADNSSIVTVADAKKEILKMIYGERGLLDDFMKIKIQAGEHPNSFLQRIQTNLETTEDLNSTFVLKTIEEKLIKNLDNATNVEFQRLLNAVGRSNLTFAKLKESLQSAVRLTNASNNGKVNEIGEILTAINAMQRSMNKNYNGGEHGPNKKYPNQDRRKDNQNKEASKRESKTKKDGSSGSRKFTGKCYECGERGHFKRNCPKAGK